MSSEPAILFLYYLQVLHFLRPKGVWKLSRYLHQSSHVFRKHKVHLPLVGQE